MPDLAALVQPGHTAVVTMEMQRGITGDLAMMPALRDELVERGVVDAAAAVCRAARAAGVRVLHCTAVSRPDRAGRVTNARLLAATADAASAFEVGSPGAEVMPELEPQADDIEIARLHGLTPFTGTALDQTLRNLGVTTVVAVGNSLNIGVLGLVLTAVDLGYQVVVPRDAVAGVPAVYGDAVMDNTISMLATITNSTALGEVWGELA